MSQLEFNVSLFEESFNPRRVASPRHNKPIKSKIAKTKFSKLKNRRLILNLLGKNEMYFTQAFMGELDETSLCFISFA